MTEVFGKLRVGDVIGIRGERGKNQSGVVERIYENFILVKTKNYRVVVNRWEVVTGMVEIRMGKVDKNHMEELEILREEEKKVLLPCGIIADLLKNECCMTICPDLERRGKPEKIEKCEHWGGGNEE